ncbi:TIGR00725 family protein [Candidatus Saccharibacteria bacterium]|nr:MAG: TIGR00725 family protein [Candidatus Saccharibacteria bacterium]
MKKPQIAVIGSAGPEEYPHKKPLDAMFSAARQIGEQLAQQQCIVVCGGKGGIMEAVSAGAKAYGGTTVGEIAGDDRFAGNDYIDVEVVTTDVGFRGPSLLIGMSDVIISLGGGAGTLQELAVAYRMKKPIILLKGYGGWTDRITTKYLDERKLVPFIITHRPEKAVQLAVNVAQGLIDAT